MILFYSKNGRLWQPMAHSLVCSDHFIGNKRSKDPRSPVYVPSVFPKIYKRQSTNEQQQNYR